MSQTSGRIIGINGNLITAVADGPVTQNEVGYAVQGDQRLKAEVIRIQGDKAFLQVFESTKGLKIGDPVDFTRELLSVELGPGLLGQIYDGLQNPLPQLAEEFGFFLPRGIDLEPLDRHRRWAFTPLVKAGDTVRAGDAVGWVPETQFEHRILVPYDLAGEWTVRTIDGPGDRTLKETVATLENGRGDARPVSLSFRWPVKLATTAYRARILPTEPLVTKVRIIDTFFPVAKGGTYCVPGPFGAGKTVIQQIISRHADVDIVIIAACGERAGEIVETMREFPLLTDPRTGRSLMERTIIIANTSSMPVAAREASVYTATTLGEYYRQMGLSVLLLADSTSRWAQAMRELSGRLEEIPGEEAFPAYLESRIAEFYERAGLVELNDGRRGSLTIGGTVSPAGGNFEEPVTQATLKVVGAFHGLSRDRANARRFPSIHPLDSWSRYAGAVPEEIVDFARDFLFRGSEVHQMMMVVGEDGTSLDDFVVYLKSEFLDAVYLQQNGFDPIDAATSPERQAHVSELLHAILRKSFAFHSKEEARTFFYTLRQKFIDCNYAAFESEAFTTLECGINDMLKD